MSNPNYQIKSYLKDPIVSYSTVKLQNALYSKLNTFSESHEFLGRIWSIPVCVADVAVQTFRAPLIAIELVAKGAIHLVGAAFSFENCAFKKSLESFEFAASCIVVFPVKIIFAPVYLLFQFTICMMDPTKAQSCSCGNPAFKN